MTYRIIFDTMTVIQYVLLDFIGPKREECIDCRTIEGQVRFKELYGYRKLRAMIKQYNTTPFPGVTPTVRTTIRWAIYFLLTLMSERLRRLFAGLLALLFVIDAVAVTAELTGLDQKTIREGKQELVTGIVLPKQADRKTGGGRPTKEEKDLNFSRALDSLIAEVLAGDPVSGRKWVRKNLRWFVDQLAEKGIHASVGSVYKRLKERKISLRTNKKVLSTRRHPDRNAQFEQIAAIKKTFLEANNPIISIDTKKKELIGPFKQNGKSYSREPVAVYDHDYPSLAEGAFIPFGILDLITNKGFISGGTSHNTAEFAVRSIVDWWLQEGQVSHGFSHKLLIFCDSGGPNGYRTRGFKYELQVQFVDRFQVEVTVCHYPPGASKWDPIEHRLFSYISRKFAGEPLTSYDKALELIQSTTTKTGLTVSAQLVTQEYPIGKKYTDAQMSSLKIERAAFLPQWNYTLKPRTS